ncbi:MAG: baseplate J/gp47 family protein [Dehalococcoidia bacterium]
MNGCDCDRLVHPSPTNIAAGLNTIPRQTGTFAEFRRALLASIPAGGPLSRWRPGTDQDLGAMLLEAWAYVCDVQSFYDEAIAHEEYLRTARRRPSIRRLVDLLGYVPRPATAASVELAVLADGRKPISLPAGAAFRSGAFDGEPPQVFELSKKASVHPLTSKWTLAWPRPSTVGVANPSSLLLQPDAANLEEDDLVLVRDLENETLNTFAQVASVADHTGADGASYTRVEFSNPLRLSSSTKFSSIRLSKPGATLGLRRESGSSIGFFEQVQVIEGIVQGAGSVRRSSPSIQRGFAAPASGGPSSISSESGRGMITLDGLHRHIKAGDFIGMVLDDDRRWYRVIENREVQLTVADPPSFTVGDSTVNPSPVAAPFTRLVLDVTVDSSARFPGRSSTWSSNTSIANRLVVHHGFAPAGQATAEALTRITQADPLILEPPVEVPADGASPGRFMLQDKDEGALVADGEADLEKRSLALDSNTDFGSGMRLPANVYGNVINATRGETVPTETLGSGDASRANQSFVLKKKPLTYVPAPAEGNDSGVASTLQVWVGGVLWKETSYFFGQPHDAPVYTVRQDDEGNSTVRFGDGVNGARLPTGSNNVIAAYRHGAGAAKPPAGSITQMAKSLKGITAIKNPVAAFGGSDAEAAENLREHAPQSALTLGRAVSMADMEAVAAGVAGVTAVKAEWTWHEKRQRPVVRIWYIGDPGIETTVGETVRSVSDPSTPIDVDRAVPIPLHLDIDVEIDSRYVEADVLANVREALLGDDEGLLLPGNLGIGTHLFRSRLFAAILEPEGAVAVHGLQFRREDPPGLVALPGYRAQVNRIHALFSGVTLTLGTRTSPTILTAQLAGQDSMADMDGFVLTAPPGHYFDIAAGSLRLNGEEAKDA